MLSMASNPSVVVPLVLLSTSIFSRRGVGWFPTCPSGETGWTFDKEEAPWRKPSCWKFGVVCVTIKYVLLRWWIVRLWLPGLVVQKSGLGSLGLFVSIFYCVLPSRLRLLENAYDCVVDCELNERCRSRRTMNNFLAVFFVGIMLGVLLVRKSIFSLKFSLNL